MWHLSEKITNFNIIVSDSSKEIDRFKNSLFYNKNIEYFYVHPSWKITSFIQFILEDFFDVGDSDIDYQKLNDLQIPEIYSEKELQIFINLDSFVNGCENIPEEISISIINLKDFFKT
jgi:hypothetical protein